MDQIIVCCLAHDIHSQRYWWHVPCSVILNERTEYNVLLQTAFYLIIINEHLLHKIL